MNKFLSTLIFIGALGYIGLAYSNVEDEIKTILAKNEAPAGVVFEIVESKESSLEWAIPQVQKYAKKLRNRFPKLNLAVVTHGKEEFALLTKKKQKYASIHEAVKKITTEEDIPVHVCGTHASWYGKNEADFPDYVDVAPAGPVQISNYEELGYVRVKLEKPR